MKDLNNTSETISVSVKKSISVKSLSVRKSRSEDVNKAKFGSFCVAILPLLFSLFALIYSVTMYHILCVLLPKYGKMAQWWNNKVNNYHVLKIGLLENTIQEFSLA